MSCEHRAREIFNGPQMRTMNRRLLEENFDCLKPVLEEKTPKSDVLLLISQWFENQNHSQTVHSR